MLSCESKDGQRSSVTRRRAFAAVGCTPLLGRSNIDLVARAFDFHNDLMELDELTSNGRFGLSGYQPRQEPGTRRGYSATVPRSLIQRDLIRIMDDQHSDLPPSVCLVQHVGDTHPLKLLAVDPISYCNPCNQCRGISVWRFRKQLN